MDETQVTLKLLTAQHKMTKHAGANGPTDIAIEHGYPLRGSNPRPMAHKTIALTTELREQLAKDRNKSLHV